MGRYESALTVTVTLVVAPLAAIPAFLIGWKSVNDGFGVVLGVAAPGLISIFLLRWSKAAGWALATLVGIVSSAVGVFVLFVAYLVGCNATNCGS